MPDALKSAPWNAPIPEKWERRPLKYCARMKGRLGWQNLRADEYTDEGPFLVTSEHFKDDNVEWSRCYHVTEERYAMAPEIQLRPQDVFFMKDGAAMGKLAYVDRLPGPACLNSHLLLFRPRRDEFTTRFLYYVLRSPLFQEFIATEATGTTFLGISQESVGTFPLPLPPLLTQRAIAAFLDRETGRVDRLVAKKRELIERLKEKRTALISRTVTRGLPPAPARATRLPANPPLKPSGVDWIGDVPKHWSVKKAKFVAKMESGHTPSRSEPANWIEDECVIPWVSLNDTKHLKDNDYIGDTAVKISEEGMRNSSAHLLPAGVVVFTRDATIGLTAITTCAAAVSQHIIAWVPGSEITPKYLLLAFKAMQQYLESFTFGSTLKTIGMTDVRKLVVPVPPLPEQAAIAAYLDEETAKLDALVGKVEAAVERLQEYRTALITAAVTGKIDVRNNMAQKSGGIESTTLA